MLYIFPNVATQLGSEDEGLRARAVGKCVRVCVFLLKCVFVKVCMCVKKLSLFVKKCVCLLKCVYLC